MSESDPYYVDVAKAYEDTMRRRNSEDTAYHWARNIVTTLSGPTEGTQYINVIKSSLATEGERIFFEKGLADGPWEDGRLRASKSDVDGLKVSFDAV